METLGAEALAEEFSPYQLHLSLKQLAQVQAYLGLLLRWNPRLNLTAVREPRRIIRELFAESMYLTRVMSLGGCLVDIGSGAGFPALALKVVAADLHVVLIESRARKCAFLKEIIRSLHLSDVEVINARFEEYAETNQGVADIATTRAVRVDRAFLERLAVLAKDEGTAVFFSSAAVARETVDMGEGFEWRQPIPIPHTESRVILVGAKKGRQRSGKSACCPWLIV